MTEEELTITLEGIKADLGVDTCIGRTISRVRKKNPISEEDGEELSKKHYNSTILRVVWDARKRGIIS